MENLLVIKLGGKREYPLEIALKEDFLQEQELKANALSAQIIRASVEMKKKIIGELEELREKFSSIIDERIQEIKIMDFQIQPFEGIDFKNYQSLFSFKCKLFQHYKSSGSQESLFSYLKYCKEIISEDEEISKRGYEPIVKNIFLKKIKRIHDVLDAIGNRIFNISIEMRESMNDEKRENSKEILQTVKKVKIEETCFPKYNIEDSDIMFMDDSQSHNSQNQRLTYNIVDDKLTSDDIVEVKL